MKAAAIPDGDVLCEGNPQAIVHDAVIADACAIGGVVPVKDRVKDFQIAVEVVVDAAAKIAAVELEQVVARVQETRVVDCAAEGVAAIANELIAIDRAVRRNQVKSAHTLCADIARNDRSVERDGLAADK